MSTPARLTVFPLEYPDDWPEWARRRPILDEVWSTYNGMFPVTAIVRDSPNGSGSVQTVYTMTFPDISNSNTYVGYATVSGYYTATMPSVPGEPTYGALYDTSTICTSTPSPTIARATAETITAACTNSADLTSSSSAASTSCSCGKPTGLIAGIAVLAALLFIALIALGLLLLRSRKRQETQEATSGFEGQSEFVISSQPSEKQIEAEKDIPAQAELMG
ncbi:hypothetical protein BJ508DRAFT_313504 [Ascobolus immersus RN42]|uniref:Mid2 domain-containing protein n=1 Tax=Ascobolus immersus RN42 TaxID=1160509 RepID=A0A3N4HLM0_ASCIM|nr:hypothetical protein BJ508DRAFT_313504 [Ascobolus immersus RN42]